MAESSLQYRQTRRRMEQGRLAYYRAEASGEYWDDVWKKTINVHTYAAAAKGQVGLFEFDHFITQFLPRTGRILEAGCGNGHLVLALRTRGYNIEGVEWGQATVDHVRSVRPDLPIRYGDVTALDVPDGHYHGYFSIGVVEHRYEGPEPFLTEAYRILDADGVALISVPYLNPIRALKARLGLYRGQPRDLPFYQYAYSRQEISGYLEKAGFTIIGMTPYDSVKGIKDEIPGLGRLLRTGIGHRISRVLRGRLFWPFGHMLFIACRKSAQGS
jgi:SAM-dependent methyltransferase